MDLEKNLQWGLKSPVSFKKNPMFSCLIPPKFSPFRGDEMSQVPMVIMAQSLHSFEVGPVLQTSLQVGKQC